jgi:hypothetical protein
MRVVGLSQLCCRSLDSVRVRCRDVSTRSLWVDVKACTHEFECSAGARGTFVGPWQPVCTSPRSCSQSEWKSLYDDFSNCQYMERDMEGSAQEKINKIFVSDCSGPITFLALF